jgi:hypothetical protein
MHISCLLVCVSSIAVIVPLPVDEFSRIHIIYRLASTGMRSGGLVTGGSDGQILLWDEQLQITHTFNLAAAAQPEAPIRCDVRSVAAKSGKVSILKICSHC